MKSRTQDRHTVGHLDPAVLDDAREYRRYPHIAYTEHHIAVTLDTALAPIDDLYPPNSHDSLAAPLRSFLRSKTHPDDLINPLRNDKFKITRSGLEKMKGWSRQIKQRPLEELLDVIETGRKDDPYPISLRPFQPLLTLSATLDARHQRTSEYSFRPQNPGQLFTPDSKLSDALSGDPAPLDFNLNVDKILNLKPMMSAAQAAVIMASRKSMSEGMKKAEERHGANVASAGIWSEWKEKYEEKIREQPRPTFPPRVHILTRSTIQIKAIPVDLINEETEGNPGTKEIVDQLTHIRTKFEIAGDERDLMDYAQDMAILAREDRDTLVPSLNDTKTLQPKSPRLRLPKRISRGSWDKEVQQSRMEALLPLDATTQPIPVYQDDQQYPEYMPDPREWEAQAYPAEHMGYWVEDGVDLDWQEEDQGIYHQSDHNSRWMGDDPGYTGYGGHAGRAIPPPQVPYHYYEDGPVPEAIWAQSGQWQGGHRQRDSTSDPTSGDLSNVELMIDTTPRFYAYPHQQPNVRPDQSSGLGYQVNIPQPDSRLPPVLAHTYQHRQSKLYTDQTPRLSYRVNIPEPVPIQPQSQARRVKKRPHSPGLDILVAKRAKLSSAALIGDELPTNKSTTDHFEVTTHLHDFVTTRTSGKPQMAKPSILKLSAGVRLTSPEFATPLKSKSRPHWRSDPLIQNAKWYNRVISRPINPEAVKHSGHILATIDFMQNVQLSNTLRKEGFEILDEDRNNLCGVDVVLSPTTGILFRPLSDLLHRSTELLVDVKNAMNHYVRVVLVFEVKSYGIKNIVGEIPKDEPDPHPPATYTALQSFTETIALMDKEVSQDRIGMIKFAFALNGACEVGRVIRAMADHPEQEFTVDDDGIWLEGHNDLQEEERILEECYAINPYAGRAILSHFAPFTSYVRQWSMEEMLEKLRPVIGVVLAERLVRKVTGPHRVGST